MNKKVIKSLPDSFPPGKRARTRFGGTTSETKPSKEQLIRELNESLAGREIDLTDPDAPPIRPDAIGFPFRDRHKLLDKKGRLLPKFRKRSA